MPSGAITVDGTAVEVSGLESSFRGTTGDFQVCTYSGGGNEGSVTIQVYFGDSEMLLVHFGDPRDLAPYADYSPGRDDPMTLDSTEDPHCRADR